MPYQSRCCADCALRFQNSRSSVIKLKKHGVPARAAFDENLTHYKAEIPQFFWFNALLIASNGTDSRVGSLTADWERFFEVRAGLAFNASSARTSPAGCRWR
jgi:type I site-specific restriction-modification system R (restriction) subunit